MISKKVISKSNHSALKAFWYLYGFRDLYMVDRVKKGFEKNTRQIMAKIKFVGIGEKRESQFWKMWL